MVVIQLIKFGSIDSINACLLSVEAKLNRMRHTMYNGFNFEDSVVNHKRMSQMETDIAYLQGLRAEMRQKEIVDKIAKVCETETDK